MTDTTDWKAEAERLRAAWRAQHDADSQELRRLCAARDAARRERDKLARQNAKLAAWLAEIEQAEPVAWVPMHPREGALWAMTTATPSDERLPSHYPLSPLYDRPSPAAAPERAEPAMYIGACITDGTLYATVMRHDANGGVTCVAQAEMDAASLVKQDCLARLSPPPDDEPAQAQLCRTCGPDGCPDRVSCPRGER